MTEQLDRSGSFIASSGEGSLTLGKGIPLGQRGGGSQSSDSQPSLTAGASIVEQSLSDDAILKQATQSIEIPVSQPHKGLNKLAVTAGSIVLAGAAGAAGLVGLRSFQGNQHADDGETDNGITTVVPDQESVTPEVVKNEHIQVQKEVFDYFTEIGLKIEDGGRTPVIKWLDNPKIKIHGNPTAADIEKINKIIVDLNNIQGSITLELVQGDEEGTLDVYLDSADNFKKILPSAQKGAGYTIVKSEPYDEKNPLFSRKIVGATVLIATELKQDKRNSVLLEEITQSLGLMNDVDTYPDSIFRQNGDDVVEYSEIDRKIIGFLYNENVKPGMLREDLLNIVEFTQ